MALWPAVLIAVAIIVAVAAAGGVLLLKEGVPTQGRLCLSQACGGKLPARALLAYRAFFFCYFLAVDIYDVHWHGPSAFLWYTQWNFSLVIVFFGLGTWISAVECFPALAQLGRRKGWRTPAPPRHLGQQARRGSQVADGTAQGWDSEDDEEGALSTFTLHRAPDYTSSTDDLEGPLSSTWEDGPPGALGITFHVLFQVCSAMVILVDTVLWGLLYPLAIRDHHVKDVLNYISYNEHIFNAVAMAGEFALNSMPYPFFRVAYLVLWAAAYVLFQWLLHGLGTRWTYFFLEYRTPTAPLWYLSLAVFHLVCFLFCYGLSKAKYRCCAPSTSSQGGWIALTERRAELDDLP